MIWYWHFFITFVIRLVPYICWWRYVWYQSLIINIRDFFLNAILGHSQIEIKFVYSCKITICQAKNSNTRENNIEKFIAPLPWLIIMNIPNCFGEFVISINNDELSRKYSGLKNFTHPQVSVHPHEIPGHSSLISTKYTNVSLVKLLRFGFKYGVRLVIYTRTKIILWAEIIWFTMGIFEKPSKNNDTVCSTPRMTVTLDNTPSKVFL